MAALAEQLLHIRNRVRLRTMFLTGLFSAKSHLLRRDSYLRLPAEDAHIMPTAPAEGALAEIIQGEQCNADTVQNWYQSCKRIHGGLCDISKTGPTLGAGFASTP